MKYIIRMTREVYHCYMDSEDKLYERPIGTIGRRNTDKKKDDFFKRYITLIMNTKIVSDTTKLYIRSTLPSVASVINYYNQSATENEKINVKTAQSKIDYDTNKLHKYFPDNMLNELAYSLSDLCDYEKRLNLAIADYSKKNKMLDNLMLKLPKVEIQDSLDEESFLKFISMIAPYFKKNIKYLEDNLPEKEVGYLLYLMSTPQLSREQQEHYNLIKEMLK